MNHPARSLRSGFTLTEAVVVLLMILFGLFVAFCILPEWQRAERNRRKVNCMSNANYLWKAASAWGLDPACSWRPTFPSTNLALALAMDNAGLAPETFICPDAIHHKINRRGGIQPATNLSAITDTNSNYNFFSGWSDTDGEKVIVCDKNGADTNGPIDADPINGHWGGNHLYEGQPAGGNAIVVAGHVKWIGLENGSCITNPKILSSFDPGTNAIVRFGH